MGVLGSRKSLETQIFTNVWLHSMFFFFLGHLICWIHPLGSARALFFWPLTTDSACKVAITHEGTSFL
jgi:hypothetical protein